MPAELLLRPPSFVRARLPANVRHSRSPLTGRRPVLDFFVHHKGDPHETFPQDDPDHPRARHPGIGDAGHSRPPERIRHAALADRRGCAHHPRLSGDRPGCAVPDIAARYGDARPQYPHPGIAAGLVPGTQGRGSAQGGGRPAGALCGGDGQHRDLRPRRAGRHHARQPEQCLRQARQARGDQCR